MSRSLDELQFTFGEGPCLAAVSGGAPVLVPDLSNPHEVRWPAFREAALEAGVSAVFAFPVTIASTHVGALDLFNRRPGLMLPAELAGALRAAELASLPLMGLMTADVDWANVSQGEEDWDQLGSLERVEVYQATGMLLAALDVTPEEALARLRAHAYAHAMTASEVAWAIVEGRLTLPADDPGAQPERDDGKTTRMP
jgi:hypothetical protein